MTVLDTVKGLIAAHGANAVGAFNVADIAALVEFIEASQAWRRRHLTPEELDADWERLEQARRKLGLAEKEAGRG